MKTVTKIITSILSILTCALVLPLVAMKLCAPEAAMAVSMIIFFTVYPINSFVIGLVSGTDVRKLFWIPIASAALFPIFFSISVGDFFIWELYIYSGIYVFISALGTVISYLITNFSKR